MAAKMWAYPAIRFGASSLLGDVDRLDVQCYEEEMVERRNKRTQLIRMLFEQLMYFKHIYLPCL